MSICLYIKRVATNFVILSALVPFISNGSNVLSCKDFYQKRPVTSETKSNVVSIGSESKSKSLEEGPKKAEDDFQIYGKLLKFGEKETNSKLATETLFGSKLESDLIDSMERLKLVLNDSSKGPADFTQNQIWIAHANWTTVSSALQKVKSFAASAEYSKLVQLKDEVDALLRDKQFFEKAEAAGRTLVPPLGHQIKESFDGEAIYILQVSAELIGMGFGFLKGLDSMYRDEFTRSLMNNGERARTLARANKYLAHILEEIGSLTKGVDLKKYDVESLAKIVEVVENKINSEYMKYSIYKLENSWIASRRNLALELKSNILKANSLFSKFKGPTALSLKIVPQIEKVDDKFLSETFQAAMSSFESSKNKNFGQDLGDLREAIPHINKLVDAMANANSVVEISPAAASKHVKDVKILLEIIKSMYISGKWLRDKSMASAFGHSKATLKAVKALKEKLLVLEEQFTTIAGKQN